MTISTTTRSVVAQGNGLTTAFNFAFAVRSAADLSAIYTDANGNQTALASSQYSVALNAVPAGQLWAQGGSVTYPLIGSPIASGTSLTIVRTLPYNQNSSLINQGGFYPDVVETALDVTEMQVQQLAQQLANCIQAPTVDSNPQMTLPAVAVRANGLLGFDASGNVAIVNKNSNAAVFSPSVQVVDSIAALKALAGPSGAITVMVRGYAAIGDGGGGFYWWNSADMTADNGGTVIQLNAGGTGRFNKLF